jgi:hypothetical protein
MNFYYDVFGGSLRSLRFVDQIKEDELYPIDIYDLVRAEMTSFFGGYELAGVPEATWNKTAKALAKKLQNPNEGVANSSKVDPNTITRSIIIHWTPSADDPHGWRDVPATRFMRHLAGHICDTTNNDALSRLKKAIGPSGMGYVHEHDAHQYRLTHLGKAPGITLWSLQDEHQETLHLPIKRVVRIRTVSDIKRLEEGDYGLPTFSNFPFADAVINGHLFQDTTAQSHPSMAKVSEILEVLHPWKADGETIALVNTLSTNNFGNFKMNKSDLMKPFSQWKTRMECHVDDTAVASQQSAVGAAGRSAGGKRKQDELAEEKPTGGRAKQAAEAKQKAKSTKK